MKLITLLFHRIEDTPSELLEVSSVLFKSVIRLCTNSQFPVVTLREMKNISSQNRENHLSFTFDDGWQSDYNVAFPLLMKNHLKATFFVNPGNVGEKGFLKWEQIKEMNSEGMEIGSHGQSHRYLTLLPQKEVYEELYAAKREIEDQLGKEVVGLAIPGGEYNKNILKTAREIGYKMISISRPGVNQEPFDVICRVSIHAKSSESEIEKILKFSSLTFAEMQVSYFSRALFKRMLGLEKYMKFRDWILNMGGAVNHENK